MAVTHTLYGPVLKNLAGGSINLGTSSTDLRLLLMTSELTFNQANEYWATVSTHEATTTYTGSTDYTMGTGGKVLTGVSLSYSTRITTMSATSKATFTSTGTIKAFHAVLAASSYLVSCVSFGEEKASAGGEFSVQWSTGGILTNTVGT